MNFEESLVHAFVVVVDNFNTYFVDLVVGIVVVGTVLII